MTQTPFDRITAFARGEYSYFRVFADASRARLEEDLKCLFASPKKTTAEIRKMLNDAQLVVPRGSYWKHKKGGVYQAGVPGFDSLTGRVVIFYVRVGGPDFDEIRGESDIIYSRPFVEWTPDRFTPLTTTKVDNAKV